MLKIIKGNIVDFKGDAIVNAANTRLLYGGGVCGAIFSAAGINELQYECDKIGYCETGKAVITSSCKMKNVKNIIHAVAPRYGSNKNQQFLLYSAYFESLKLCASHSIKTIGIPSLGTGIYGYPVEEASKIALRAIYDYFEINPNIDVTLILFNDNDLKIYRKNNFNLLKLPVSKPHYHKKFSTETVYCTKKVSLDLNVKLKDVKFYLYTFKPTMGTSYRSYMIIYNKNTDSEVLYINKNINATKEFDLLFNDYVKTNKCICNDIVYSNIDNLPFDLVTINNEKFYVLYLLYQDVVFIEENYFLEHEIGCSFLRAANSNFINKYFEENFLSKDAIITENND